jgi:hypothetical protein
VEQKKFTIQDALRRAGWSIVVGLQLARCRGYKDKEDVNRWLASEYNEEAHMLVQLLPHFKKALDDNVFVLDALTRLVSGYRELYSSLRALPAQGKSPAVLIADSHYMTWPTALGWWDIWENRWLTDEEEETVIPQCKTTVGLHLVPILAEMPGPQK